MVKLFFCARPLVFTPTYDVAERAFRAGVQGGGALWLTSPPRCNDCATAGEKARQGSTPRTLTVHFYHPSPFIFHHPSQFVIYHPSQFIFYHPSQFIFYHPSQFLFYQPSQFVIYHPSRFIFYHPSQFVVYHRSQFIFYHPSQFVIQASHRGHTFTLGG